MNTESRHTIDGNLFLMAGPVGFPARISFALLSGLFVLAGCKDSNGPVLPLSDVTGTWVGSTAQGELISYSVSGGGVTQIQFSWHLSGTLCGSSSAIAVSIIPPAPIQDNKFRIQQGVGGQQAVALTILGEFKSAQSAEGDLRVVDSNCDAAPSVRWSALKE